MGIDVVIHSLCFRVFKLLSYVSETGTKAFCAPIAAFGSKWLFPFPKRSRKRTKRSEIFVSEPCCR